MHRKKLSELKVGEIWDLNESFLSKNDASRMSLVEIGKNYLSYILNINTFELEFEEIKEIYANSSKNEEVSINEDDFYKNIAKEYLWLVDEPKEKFLEFFHKAKDDIRK